MATAVARGPPGSLTPSAPPPAPSAPPFAPSAPPSTPSAPPSTSSAPPSAPPTPRAKKKVRMQEVVMDEELQKPVDTFHVEISDVRAVLRVAEPRPVLLSFEFDSYWYAETNVYSEDVRPKWFFNATSMRGHDGRKPVTAAGERQTPATGIIPAAKFVYETEFGYKLHRKFLVVKLAERSPYGDVEWGTGVLPLDSIARGSQKAEISIVAKDNVTCYGNVHCHIKMVNIQKVRAHLTDLKLSDYPEAYSYDVKLIYLEFGLKGFEAGYNKCTEKRSDGEPRYTAQPALEYHTSLRDMLVSSSSGSPSLKIFFSVHRQVARNRTEEIGVGALPVRMLFSKITEGWMDFPTKFRVPLANYKGVIRGKVLLRNIPQFSQLPGDDLINADGNILPLDVDLSSRKLLPWVKLPRSLEAKSRSVNGANSKGLTHSRRPGAPDRTMANGMRQAVNDGVEKPSSAALAVAAQYHSSVTESASDGSESSVGSPHRKPRATSNGISYHDAEVRPSFGTQAQYAPADPEEARKSATSPLAVRDQIYGAEPENSYDMAAEIIRAKLEGRSVPDRNEMVHAKAEPQAQQLQAQHEWMRSIATAEEYCQEPERISVSAQPQDWMRGMTRDEEFVHESRKNSEVRERTTAQPDWVGAGRKEEAVDSNLHELGGLRIANDSRGEKMDSRERAEVNATSRYYETTTWEGTKQEESELAAVFRERRNKSSKSFGSLGTADGGVEIGSVVLSTASDDGYVPGSRTTTEDALTASQRLSTGPPSEERYDVDDEDTGLGEMYGEGVKSNGSEIVYNADGLDEAEEDEWLAILDGSSSRYYFAHKYTQESLWLPPEWERMEDEDGRQYFVDHGCRTTQRGFPATEARAYRESVYTSR